MLLVNTAAFTAPLAAAEKTAEEAPVPQVATHATVSAASQARLTKAFLAHLTEAEGVALMPYVDTTGNLTIGFGLNIETPEAFKKVRFQKGSTATVEPAVRAIAKKLKSDAKNFKNGRFNLSYNAQKRHFAAYAISEVEAGRLFQDYLAQNLPRWKENCRRGGFSFDTQPAPVQLALMDMFYNMGPTRFSKDKWPKLFKALKEKKYLDAAKQSHRAGVNKARNAWTSNLLKAPVFIDTLQKEKIISTQTPEEAVAALDMMYGFLGEKLTAKNFPKFFGHLKNKNWAGCAKECASRRISPRFQKEIRTRFTGLHLSGGAHIFIAEKSR